MANEWSGPDKEIDVKQDLKDCLAYIHDGEMKPIECKLMFNPAQLDEMCRVMPSLIRYRKTLTTLEWEEQYGHQIITATGRIGVQQVLFKDVPVSC